MFIITVAGKEKEEKKLVYLKFRKNIQKKWAIQKERYIYNFLQESILN